MIYMFEWHHESVLDKVDMLRRLFRHANVSLRNHSTCTCVRTCKELNRWDSRNKLYSRHLMGRWSQCHNSKLNHKLYRSGRHTVSSVASSVELKRTMQSCFPSLLVGDSGEKRKFNKNRNEIDIYEWQRLTLAWTSDGWLAEICLTAAAGGRFTTRTVPLDWTWISPLGVPLIIDVVVPERAIWLDVLTLPFSIDTWPCPWTTRWFKLRLDVNAFWTDKGWGGCW